MGKKERKQKKAEEQLPATRDTGAGLVPFEEIERRLESLFSRNWLRPFGLEFGDLLKQVELPSPKVDVIDRDDEVVVRADLPGVKKEDLEVSVAGNTLTLRGETHREKREEKGDYFRQETFQGSFIRSVPLPAEVDPDKARARFKDGVLEVELPKVEQARKRAVPIEEA